MKSLLNEYTRAHAIMIMIALLSWSEWILHFSTTEKKEKSLRQQMFPWRRVRTTRTWQGNCTKWLRLGNDVDFFSLDPYYARCADAAV